MRKGIKFPTILLLLIISINSFAQEGEKLSRNEVNELAEKADLSFEEKNYIDALDEFTQLYNDKPSDIYYKLMMGICLTYDPVQKQKAIEIIEQVKITNPEYNLCNFYLAKAYAVNYEFDKAVNLFNMFLARAEKGNIDQINLAKKMIRNCQSAKEVLVDTITKYSVENIQYPINSQYSEYVPIISADESVMIFTYRGIKSKGADKIESSMGSEAYSEDVFISYKENGIWTEPVSISDNINNEGHDAAIALSVDGQTLFIYKSDGGGDIYVSRLVGNIWLIPQKLLGDVNKEDSWEGSCSLSANGKILYFASDREGGLGGRDIYSSEIQKDGSWGLAKNLGETVNTTYNDDAPFIHSANKTLYFSSQGHTSIGGYDIFSVVADGNGAFSNVENLGYPINTIDDNRFFVLAADGKTGYYSGAGVNSIGEQDIFKISAGKIEKPVLALILGKVYLKDELTGSTMNLYRQDNGDLEGSFVSNMKTGKYVMALTPGSYEIVVELESGETIIDSINMEYLTTYVELEKDFRFYNDSNLITEKGLHLQGIIESKFEDTKKLNDLVVLSNLELEQENKKNDSLLALPRNKMDKENERVDSLLAVSYLQRKKVINEIGSLLTETSLQKEKTNNKSDNLFYQNIEEEIQLKPLEAGDSFTLNNILYDVDKFILRYESKIILNRLVIILNENKKLKLKIGSHTDSRMSKEHNLTLSQKRAQSVVDYLISKGIDKERLVAMGFGESLPIASNMYMQGRQINRRTDFTILKSK